MAYSGGKIMLEDLLFKPKDNLIDQSLNSRSAETPTNGDGFGVGMLIIPFFNEQREKIHLVGRLSFGAIFNQILQSCAIFLVLRFVFYDGVF
jgi:hypothetical protein